MKGKTIAIIGYGIQGRAQALCLRDSGLEVIVSEIQASPNYQVAVDDGDGALDRPVDPGGAAVGAERGGEPRAGRQPDVACEPRRGGVVEAGQRLDEHRGWKPGGEDAVPGGRRGVEHDEAVLRPQGGGGGSGSGESEDPMERLLKGGWADGL